MVTQGGHPVYPRVCGGTHQGRAADSDNAGLSPRVRGNPCFQLSSKHTRRSIPACAGEPSWAGCSKFDLKVYPRVCGGTPLGSFDDQVDAGLSPRVRGNPLHVDRR